MLTVYRFLILNYFRTQKQFNNILAELRNIAMARLPDAEPRLHGRIASHRTRFNLGGDQMATNFQNILVAVFEPSFHPDVCGGPNPVSPLEIHAALEPNGREVFRRKLIRHSQQYTNW